MNPRVKTAIPLENYRLRLTFTDLKIKIYDCTPILNFGIFEELKNIEYFSQVKVKEGTVTWPNDQDICPDTLYLESTDET